MKKAVLFFLLCSTVKFAASQTKLFVPPLPEMSYTRVTDTTKFLGDRWSYMEAGPKEAPAIIMMHGYGGSSVDWRYQLHELSQYFRVIAWNAPGYMLSDELKTNYPVAKDYADVLLDFITALQLDQVYLAGNSFGSRIAQAFAFYYPHKVIKMALVGPSAGKRNTPYEERMRYTNFRYGQIKDGPYAFANKRVEALLAPGSSTALIELARKGMRGVNQSMFMKGVHFILAEDHHPQLMATKVTMPTLIIAGTEDKVSPIAINADSIMWYFKNAKLEILKNIGHLPHLEAPEKVNALLLDFFSSNGTLLKNRYRQQTMAAIDSLTQLQVKWTLAQDTASVRKYAANDLMITNPFGQLINKDKMIERMKADIIKYTVFEKKIENYQFEYDDVVITQGTEKTTAAPSANRDDAGKPTNRRFTEVWVRRSNEWVRITRHASNITP